MKSLAFLSISLLLIGCSSEPEQRVTDGPEIRHEIEPTSNTIYLSSRENMEEYHFQCSDDLRRINDTTIEPVTDLLGYYDGMPDFALFDWNDDGYNDLFFEYYGPFGTGVKYRIEVYEYDPKTRKYKEEPYAFMNPAYYCHEKIITTHYCGNGGGYALKYQVTDGKFEVIESINIEIEIDSVEYLYSQYPFTDTIRVTDTELQLPPEYIYEPIIKN